jgi:hypothetical protein
MEELPRSAKHYTLAYLDTELIMKELAILVESCKGLYWGGLDPYLKILD